MKVKCRSCDGDGWEIDHSELHKRRPDLDCSQAGCPVQVQCFSCQGEGHVDIDEEPEKA